jgi:glycosyltransferase involved in cell wall biosynthesis
MQKLKFLITAPFYYPCPDIVAVSDHVGALAEALASRGYEVHIVHSLDVSVRLCKFYPTTSDWKDMVSKEQREHPGVFIHTLRSPLRVVDPIMTYLFGSSQYVNRQFRSILKEVKPDIVHYFSPKFFGHHILKKHGNYLSVYTASDFWLICPMGYLLKDGQRDCDKKTCFSCAIRSRKPPELGRYTRSFRRAVYDIDLILVESTLVKEKLGAELNKRIECIPHYLPYEKQEIRPSGYSNYFLFSGQLELSKGVLNLLEAFRRYRDKINAQLIITGRGRLENQIKKFIAKNNIQDKVMFLGWVDKELLWSLYKDALALVVPSIALDPGPMVVVDALSAGTPVIASDRSGYGWDIIRKIDKGLVFNNGDVEGLAEILATFNSEHYPPEELKRICERQFSLQSYVSRYLDILGDMKGRLART